ncbi:MAG: PSD1 and planctomycete cytochrome C domain-containing protein [Cyclobacteriaceae bacterium]
MKFEFVSFSVLLLLMMTSCSSRKIDFNTEVRPIFNNKCISCHGGVKQSGGFGLVFRENALAKTTNDKYAIVPGKPEKSELIARIKHHDPEMRMPLDAEPLKEEEIKILTEWIEQGAEWEEHWAYLLPEEPEIPQIDHDWGVNPVDKFTLEKMLENDLAPSAEANKYDLIRRVSLDLTGLPPTLEEVDQFVNDQTENSYEKLVDRLLASPQFGEHWATMWLDLARYADSRGYEKDSFRSIWMFRDWVVRAFNEDKPFDEFTVEQLAGDLLPDPTIDQLVATGFHRNTLNNDEGGTFNEEYRIAQVIDRVNTTWEVWQASTMGCVQCHSHPYDPIKMKDFYRSMAFFNNTADWDVGTEFPVLKDLKEEDELKLVQLKDWIATYGSPDLAEEVKHKILTGTPRIIHEDYTDTTGAVHQNRGDQDFMEVFDGSSISVSDFDLTGKGYLVFFFRQRDETGKVVVTANGKEIGREDLERSGSFTQMVIDLEPYKGVAELTLHFSSDHENYRTYTDGFFLVDELPGKGEAGYEERVAELKALFQADPENTTLIMQDKPDRFQRVTRVFHRGSWQEQEEAVEPAVPASLRDDSTQLKNRLDLAKWLVSDENPLTARVMVNRFWSKLFGVGIVETVEDFGTIGANPTHPELLDWLALRFSDDYKWSMKKLVKTIVMSATYRQTSVVSELAKANDPNNVWLSFSPRTRLSAEQLRDQTLAVTGLLSDKMYGPSVMPYQPEGIWNVVYSGNKWVVSDGEDAYRRGLYTFLRRSAAYPSFITFDASSRDVCVSRRINTNTPLQALTTLNDPAYVEAATHLAKEITQLEVDDEKKLKLAYQRVMCKPPSSEKLNLLKTLYKEMHVQYTNDRAAAVELVGEPDAKKAAMVIVANTLLNMDEFIVKS